MTTFASLNKSCVQAHNCEAEQTGKNMINVGLLLVSEEIPAWSTKSEETFSEQVHNRQAVKAAE